MEFFNNPIAQLGTWAAKVFKDWFNDQIDEHGYISVYDVKMFLMISDIQDIENKFGWTDYINNECFKLHISKANLEVYYELNLPEPKSLEDS